MSIDTIGNFLTIIRNGIMASKPYVCTSQSKVNAEIARILKEEGFIKSYDEIGTGIVDRKIKIFLKYVDGESVIHSIDRVSKPSRRVYVAAKNIKPVIGGLGISIISTNRGIMTDKTVKQSDVLIGGEVLCKVW